MTVFVLKQCEVHHNAATLQLVAGDFLVLPDGKAAKLISIGYARPAVADDYRQVIADFNRNIPEASTWSDIKQKNPTAWKRHIQALLKNDISTARLTYNEMVTGACK